MKKNCIINKRVEKNAGKFNYLGQQKSACKTYHWSKALYVTALINYYISNGMEPVWSAIRDRKWINIIHNAERWHYLFGSIKFKKLQFTSTICLLEKQNSATKHVTDVLSKGPGGWRTPLHIKFHLGPNSNYFSRFPQIFQAISL